MAWNLWGSVLGDRFMLEQITTAKKGQCLAPYPGALSPAEYWVVLSEGREIMLNRQA